MAPTALALLFIGMLLNYPRYDLLVLSSFLHIEEKKKYYVIVVLYIKSFSINNYSKDFIFIELRVP